MVGSRFREKLIADPGSRGHKRDPGSGSATLHKRKDLLKKAKQLLKVRTIFLNFIALA